MNCPIHRIRQLDERFWCADCGKTWKKDALTFFWNEYADLKKERDSAMTKIECQFMEAVAHVLGNAIERYGWLA